MHNFVITCVEDIYVKELSNLSAESFSSPTGDEEYLKSTPNLEIQFEMHRKMHHIFGQCFMGGLLSYDNVNIPFCVFSQRFDKQNDIGTGSAATIYIKYNVKHLPPSANMDLQETPHIIVTALH